MKTTSNIKKMALIVVACALVYVCAYFALLTPTQAGPPGHLRRFSLYWNPISGHQVGPDSVLGLVFEPARRIDFVIRPHYWSDIPSEREYHFQVKS
jgi:hypothetical protein